jgi:site-specific DNA-methyltransferase (adenine-specific)
MKAIPDKSIGLIICDLPFGCLTGGGGKEKAKRNERFRFIDGVNTNTIISSDIIGGCAWDIPIDLEVFWKEVKRIRKDEHTPTLMFCNTKFGYDLIKSNEKEFRYDLVWDKQRGVSFLSANKMPMKSHEMIYVFSKLGANYNRIDIEVEGAKECKQFGKPKVGGVYGLIRENEVIRPVGTITSKEGVRCVLSIINFKNTSRGSHPTEKPIELYKFLIERFSSQGDEVLDPTFGSANSGLACKQLNRSYIGIEKDNRFFWKATAKFI